MKNTMRNTMKNSEFDMILDRQATSSELLLQALNGRHETELISLMNSLHPADVAEALDHAEIDHLQYLCPLLSDQQLADILEQSSEELQYALLQQLSEGRILSLCSSMQSDEVADLLGLLPTDRRKELIRQMKSSESHTIQELLSYAKDSAGGLMTTEYIALSETLNIGEALNKIREIAPRTEVLETIFVLDSRNRLTGTADLRDILTTDEETLLSSISEEVAFSVHPDADQEEVALLTARYDLSVVPVINQKNILLGIITVDDIIEVMVNEYSEDMLKLGGVSKEERIDDKASMSVKKRLPWLMINLATAFLAAFTVGLFEDVIGQVVALAAAMPIVAGMGGNAGTQTLSIVIRSITLGEVRLKTCLPLLRKEIAVSVINGAVTGLFTGLILYLRYDNPYLGLIIFISMMGNLIIAGFFGFLIPLILKHFHADPALASSIFLTTATDVFGFFLFLGLAQMFLPLLL